MPKVWQIVVILLLRYCVRAVEMQVGSRSLACLQRAAGHIVSSPWVSFVSLMRFFYLWVMGRERESGCVAILRPLCVALVPCSEIAPFLCEAATWQDGTWDGSCRRQVGQTLPSPWAAWEACSALPWTQHLEEESARGARCRAWPPRRAP